MREHPADQPAANMQPRFEDTIALAPNRRLVRGRLTGNFPGGVADLYWDFTASPGPEGPAAPSAAYDQHRHQGAQVLRAGEFLPEVSTRGDCAIDHCRSQSGRSRMGGIQVNGGCPCVVW